MKNNDHLINFSYYRSTPAPPTSPVPSIAAISHELPPVRPPKRDDQRGEPLTNQSTSSQPHPSLPAVVGSNIKEPISFQYPFSSNTHKISSPEVIDKQQGFPLQQEGIMPPQQGCPPRQQGPSPRQQDLSQQPPQQQGLPPEQQGLPPQQQGLHQQQQGLSQQQQGLSQQQHGLSQQQQGFPPQLLDNVEQQSILPDQQILLPQQPVLSPAQANHQMFSLQQPQLHPEEQPAELSPESSVHVPTVNSDVNTEDNMSPLVVTISDQSSDSMMQSLVTPSISSSSVAMVPIKNSENTTLYTPSAVKTTVTLSYGNIQSGGEVQTAQSNSLDQLNAFG